MKLSKKSAAKSNAKHADDSKQKWTINKDSTMIRNQRLSSNDRDRNVYLAFLPMKQRQDTILVIFGYDARSRTRSKKKEEIRSHTFVLVESVDSK